MPDKDRNSSIEESMDVPMNIPSESKVPDHCLDLATSEDYDTYFQIARKNAGLLEWSRSCLKSHFEQLNDLEKTSLSMEDKASIMQGMLIVQQATLKKWVTAYSESLGAV